MLCQDTSQGCSIIQQDWIARVLRHNPVSETVIFLLLSYQLLFNEDFIITGIAVTSRIKLSAMLDIENCND